MGENKKKQYQENEIETIWSSLENFFVAQRMVQKKYMDFSRSNTVSFEDFDDIIALLDKARDYSHDIFRDEPEEASNPQDPGLLYDFVISTIYHEMLHVKEYVYIISTYGPIYGSLSLNDKHFSDGSTSMQEWVNRHTRDIYKNAKNNLPVSFSNTWKLFGNCEDLLRFVLPAFSDTSLPRIAYWNHKNKAGKKLGSSFMSRFFDLMFKDGSCNGYFVVGKFLSEGGFFAESLSAFQLSLSQYKKNPSKTKKVFMNSIYDLCVKSEEKSRVLDKTIHALEDIIHV